MAEDYRIGIIGTEEAIAGFHALGVTCFFLKEDKDIEKVIHKIEREKYAILFITEDWAKRVRNNLDEIFAGSALPAVVTVPSQSGATDAGKDNLRRIVEQAVGSDILFNN